MGKRQEKREKKIVMIHKTKHEIKVWSKIVIESIQCTGKEQFRTVRSDIFQFRIVRHSISTLP